MPIITENQLRELIRQPQEGMTVTLPQGTRFSPSAQDFIKHWKIAVQFGEESSELQPYFEETGPAEKPGWDKPGAFPVVLTGDLPRCTTCGMPVKPKPEHMTQLDARHFSPKNSPRIRFRGKMDTLHSLTLLVLARAKAESLPALAEALSTLAAYCREITSAEYNQRQVQPLSLLGLDEEALRKATHNPESAIGVAHIVPAPGDPEILHWLNLLRCQVRETEITALDAFMPLGSAGEEPDIVRAINRLSNAVYYLELLFVAGKLK